MIRNGLAEHSVTFFGGRIAVAPGVGTSNRGTERPTKTPYIAFQELVDPVEIGSDVPKDAGQFPPRLYVFFRKKESLEVVIRGLEKLREKFQDIEKEEAALAQVNAELKEELKENKDDSGQGVPG